MTAKSRAQSRTAATEPESTAPAGEPDERAKPNAGMDTEQSKASTAEIVAERDDLTVEGIRDASSKVFSRTFVVSLKGIAGGADTLTDEAFHNANKVATMQDVINAGYRATGDVAVAAERVEGEGPRATLYVDYSVPIVLASADEREPSTVPAPRAMIVDMGGTTMADQGDQPA